MLVEARGLRTYVEVSGSGPPLLFLHGAAEWIGYSADLVGRLEEHYRVIQPERQGHGRTPDRRGELTYASMTADTVELIENMGLTRPHLVGFSDGAIIALEAAMARPDLVGKVVAIAPNVSVSGLTDEALEWLREVTPDTWPGEAGTKHDNWPVLARKVIDMLRREPEIPLAELARIQAPVLVVGADHDMVRLEHLVDIHRAIPDSQLCIVPGASHELTVERPELVAQATLQFLAGG
jgi:pimeloyl-ACP methyl ester carboxylesterase